MRAELTSTGVLFLQPDSDAEGIALQAWFETNQMQKRPENTFYPNLGVIVVSYDLKQKGTCG